MDNCNCNLAAPILEIPHTVVDTRFVDGKDVTKKYPGYYVEVRDENTVYHVSTPKGGCVINSLPIARVPIFKDNYNPSTMATYRNNVVIDFTQNKVYIFDFNKNYRIVYLSSTLGNLLVDVKVDGVSVVDRSTQTAVIDLTGKVDKEAGKGLSTNDLTNELKAGYDGAVTDSHTHTNKSVLDNATASYTLEEQNKLAGLTVGDGTITINQGGTLKGTFTANQSGDTEINLD